MLTISITISISITTPNPNHNHNLNLNPNPNFNLNPNYNLNLNLNVDRGYPWLTAHHDCATVDDRGYPWLQLTFVRLNAAILIICRRFLAICGLGFGGLFPFSALGLLFAALKQLDPVAHEPAVRKHFHALNLFFLKLDENGVFVLRPVIQ